MYNISVLSTLPSPVLSFISPSSPNLSRLRPLFSIGVHDLALLEYSHQRVQASYNNTTSDESISPWIACTTDEVLRLKSSLYDVVVTLPPRGRHRKKCWPKIESPVGVLVKATQRDLRRYRKLRKGLEQYTMITSPPRDVPESSEVGVDDYKTTSNDEEAACEKASWKELAYSGFLWWASAGEKRQDNNAEEDVDRVAPAIGRVSNQGEQFPLLDSFADGGEDCGDNFRQRRASAVDTSSILSPQTPGLPGPQQYGSSDGVEMDIVAYFHRLTTRIFEGMAEIIQSSGSEYMDSGINEEEEEEEVDDATSEQRGLLDGSGFRSQSLTSQPVDIWLSKDEVVGLGLDRWSISDEKFVEEMGQRWWQRNVAVEKGGVCHCFC